MFFVQGLVNIQQCSQEGEKMGKFSYRLKCTVAFNSNLVSYKREISFIKSKDAH